MEVKQSYYWGPGPCQRHSTPDKVSRDTTFGGPKWGAFNSLLRLPKCLKLSKSRGEVFVRFTQAFILEMRYRLFFLRSIAQFFTQIYMNKLGKFL